MFFTFNIQIYACIKMRIVLPPVAFSDCKDKKEISQAAHFSKEKSGLHKNYLSKKFRSSLYLHHCFFIEPLITFGHADSTSSRLKSPITQLLTVQEYPR